MHSIVIPLLALATAAACALLARSGMRWFRTLRLPQLPFSLRSIAWIHGVMLTLGAASAILSWSAMGAEEHERAAAVYAVNAFLNAAWCYMLFVRHQIGSATLVAALMAIGIAIIALDVYPASAAAALLVVPFFIWVLLGMFVSLTVFRMNVRAGGGDV